MKMEFTKSKPISIIKKWIYTLLHRRRKILFLLSGIIGVLIILMWNRVSAIQHMKDEAASTTNVIMMNTSEHQTNISNGLPETLNKEIRSTKDGGLPPNKPVDLILNYMRSGSSITADLLARGSGAFLYYEPLHALSKLRNFNQMLNLTSGESKLFLKEQFSDVAGEIMDTYLRCTIDHSYCAGYTDNFLQMRHSKLFATCIRTFKRGHAPCTEYSPCQMILKHECMSSNYVVMKTIRASMDVVRYLFPAVPNLRVIHLTRNARATLNSQKKFGVPKGIDINEFVFRFCQRVRDNIQSKMEIEKKFPGRILQIKYEDLSLNPIKTLQEMYEFSGINFTEEIAEYAWNVTYKAHRCKGFMCTRRPNASSLMSAWRKTMPYNHVKIIDEKCADVYHHLGYLPTKNEKVLRNLTESLTVS